MIDNYYTTEEISEKFRVSRQTVWRWKKLGKIVSKKIGRRNLFSEKDIKNLLGEV
jgi:excisionase family DNA binding protein